MATKARQTRIRARLRMIAFQCRAGREQLGSLGSPIRLRKWPIWPRFGLGEWELVYCFSCCSKLYVELPAFAGAARNPRVEMQPKFALRPDSSVVERGPEKAGVGGSIPSLATTALLDSLNLGRAPVLRASAIIQPAAPKRPSASAVQSCLWPPLHPETEIPAALRLCGSPKKEERLRSLSPEPLIVPFYAG